MPGKTLAICAGLAVFGLAGAAQAIPADIELSLVIDESGSITNTEFTQQVQGYANAFRQTPIIDSIVNTTNGVAINTVFFASSAAEIIPFTLLQTAQDVADFADALDAIDRSQPVFSTIGSSTNIDTGVLLAVETIANNNFESGNIIIDVSGDGLDSASSTEAARDAALSAGVTRINALAIESDSVFNFFQASLIGGPDAFVLKADSFDEFAEAIGIKIAAELGAPVEEEEETVSVPEPGVISMLGFGFLALGFAMRSRVSS